jgi:radical SAM superfamily enzyme YgiQ (UPF0313 family)
MRVLLIQPPMFHLKVNVAPNVGIASIAAVLEREGVAVGIIDAAAEDLSFDQIIHRAKEFSPDIVGAGGQTPVSHRSLQIFRRVKREVSPRIYTIAGGPHFTFTDMESLKECPELDIVVRGEAEITLLELCRALEAGNDLGEVEGITFRNAKGEITSMPDREPIPDLDSLPFPAWHLFPYRNYHWAGNRLLGITSSRGCAFRCPHCITWKIHKGVRYRKPEQIVEEMCWVKKNFGIDTFFFHDDQTFTRRDQLEGFLDELESAKERLYWYFEIREDTLLNYRDLWKRMRDLGMFKVAIGLETPNPKVRDFYGKKAYQHKEVEDMLSYLEHELDVLVAIYLLIGSPHDTEETIQETIKYAKFLYPDCCSFVVGTIAVPFPGTDFFEEMKAKDMITTYDWKYYGFGQSLIKSSVPPEKMVAYFGAFWKGAYVRPKVFLKQIEFALSKNRFRRSLAKSYINIAVDFATHGSRTDASLS